MNSLLEREGYRIESIVPAKKKTKEKKIKRVEHVKIIDDDAPIPWSAKKETEKVVSEEIISVEDDPVVVGVVDDRPAELREKERFNDMKRWRSTAFEEIPDSATIGPQPKPTKKSSRRKQNSSDDSDPEIDRSRGKAKEDSDLSPPRRKTQRKDDDPSPPRRRTHIKEDPSPPRRREPTSAKSRSDDPSPPRRRSHADRDASPPRRSKHGDSSPPRRQQKHRDDDDPSPPRRHRETSSPPHRHRDRQSRTESSSSRFRVKDEPRSPSASRRPRKELTPPPSPPPPPSQPAKSERRRLAEHKEELADRYKKWGRGVAQVRQAEETVKDFLETAEKPLARYRDDNDLDVMLKQREREDDPMLKYLTSKASEQGERTSDGARAPPKPRYKGPDPQKNRFDIWPGYRWDGVDRSNGYERKLFESIANRHAKSQEAYLWSVEDM